MFRAMVRGLLGGEQEVAVATAATTAAEPRTARLALGRADTADRNDTKGPLSRLRGELSGSGKSGPAGHHHVLATRLHPKGVTCADRAVTPGRLGPPLPPTWDTWLHDPGRDSANGSWAPRFRWSGTKPRRPSAERYPWVADVKKTTDGLQRVNLQSPQVEPGWKRCLWLDGVGSIVSERSATTGLGSRQ